MIMDIPVLGYWDIRCLAEPIRLMLHYLKINFEDKRYPTGDPPSYDRTEWKNDKFSIGLDFPNLPYWIDESIHVTESWAIMKHIARQNEVLYPHCNAEHLKCDMVEGVIEAFRYRFIDMCYAKTDTEFNELKEKFIAKLEYDLTNFEKFMGNSIWLASNSILYVDFVLCETLDQIRLFMPKFLSDHLVMQKYLSRFDSLQQISEYRTSNMYHPFPINSKYAYWGGGLTL